MGRSPGTVTSTPADPGAAEWREAHAASGLTSGLILAYVERDFGRPAVDDLLRRVDMAGREQELRDEDAWFSFQTKIRLWDAAAAVTGDASVAERVGEAGAGGHDRAAGLSCSAGVAVAAGAQTRGCDLFSEADRALYAAKRAGRGRTILALG